MKHVWRDKLAKQFVMSLGVLDERRPFDALRTAVQPDGRLGVHLAVSHLSRHRRYERDSAKDTAKGESPSMRPIGQE